MTTINYKGFEIEISVPIKNPNGQISRTALIYKDSKIVGGCFADTQFENLATKIKSKILKYTS